MSTRSSKGSINISNVQMNTRVHENPKLVHENPKPVHKNLELIPEPHNQFDHFEYIQPHKNNMNDIKRMLKSKEIEIL